MFKSTYFRTVVALCLWCLLMLAIAAAYFWNWLNTAEPINQNQRILVVEKGDGVGVVAQRLSDRHLLRWPTVWRIYNRFFQPATIKAGEYALAPYESPISLLTLLQGGEVITYNVTFAEGLTLKEWLHVLAEEEKLDVEAQAMTPQQIANYLDINQSNPEGWFFPDTYRFEKGDSDLDILKRAHAKMKAELAAQWARRRPSLPYKTDYELLIMASIVERETGVPHEREEIAGVFTRRLEKNMRLQTDPTVIYGMGDDYRGNIRRSDLKKPTPYNTYVINGLPPTPIANPGREALAAAVNPAAGNTLYFVAKGDGSHHFSETLEEHNRAVRKYQLNRDKNYRSTLQVVESSSTKSSESE